MVFSEFYHLIHVHYMLGTMPGSLYMKRERKIVFKIIAVDTNPTPHCVVLGSAGGTEPAGDIY